MEKHGFKLLWIVSYRVFFIVGVIPFKVLPTLINVNVNVNVHKELRLYVHKDLRSWKKKTIITTTCTAQYFEVLAMIYKETTI